MAGQTRTTGAKFTGDQWWLLILLIVSVHISFFDRGNLSVAAPTLSEELSLPPDQLGLLLSAFALTYSFALPLAGWMVDRYSTKTVFILGFFVWSVATLGGGIAQSFYHLFALRLLLGIGESVAYPTYSKIIVSSFPEEQRGLVNSLVDLGAKIGPGLSTLLGGLVVAQLGWRALFLILGFVSFGWLVPWIKWTPSESITRLTAKRRPGFIQILRRRDAWGTFLGHFSANYLSYLLMSWLPYFLVTEMHYSLAEMAVWGSAPFMACAVSSLPCGWLSDRWIAHGRSPTYVRKVFVVTGLLIPALLLPGAMAANRMVVIGLVTIAFFAYGLCASNFMAITQTLAGPEGAGSWTGIQTCIASLAGICAPFLTGVIVSKTGSFFLAFLLTSFVLILGASSYLFIVRRVEPINWASER